MNVQVLVATMHQSQDDFSLLERMNIQSDAVVVNQCDREGCRSFRFRAYSILWIDSLERGLSNSRNLALSHASGDVCVLCDDDEVLSDGYPLMIAEAFDSVSQADVIVFNINRIGYNETERMFTAPEKIGYFKTYSSVHITFKREKIQKEGIVFDTRFGTGSGMYSSAEDAIFCMDCHKSKLKMYTYPGILCSVNCEQSTWFSGYDKKYFFDVGAYLAATFPVLKNILKWYYPYRCRKITALSIREIILAINAGIRGYKSNLSYGQYWKNQDEIK